MVEEDPELLDILEADARSLAALPPPFRRIIEVRRSPESLEITQERFVGLSGRTLVAQLARAHRLLPLDVWLAIGGALCSALSRVPASEPAWSMVPSIDSFGVDVRRRFVVFPDPDLSLAIHRMRPGTTRVLRAPRFENCSPEFVSGNRSDECSRVFSVATVLVELLTLERPFRRDNDLDVLQAVLDADARWTPSHHPGCPPTLAAVLNRALQSEPAQRPATLDELRGALNAAAGCEPASLERVANVVLGVDRDHLHRMLALLRGQPELLPPSWRDGGIDVIEDQLLESLVPVEALPVNAGLAPSRPRVRAPPRVNLAPKRRRWWQGMWPFGG